MTMDELRSALKFFRPGSVDGMPMAKAGEYDHNLRVLVDFAQSALDCEGFPQPRHAEHQNCNCPDCMYCAGYGQALMLSYAAFAKEKARWEEERKELTRKGEELCQRLGVLMVEHQQLKAQELTEEEIEEILSQPLKLPCGKFSSMDNYKARAIIQAQKDKRKRDVDGNNAAITRSLSKRPICKNCLKGKE